MVGSSKRVFNARKSARSDAARKIQRAARQKAFTKARGGLPTVRKIQRQPYAPRIVKNTASIAQLSRAVAALQNAKNGHIQRQWQDMHCVGDNVITGPNFSPEFEHPFAFQLNNFYSGPIGAGNPLTSLLMRGHKDSSGNANVTNEGYWETRTYNTSFFPDNQVWMGKQEDNDVSVTCYQPLFTRVNMYFFGTYHPTAEKPILFRVQVFRVNPGPTQNQNLDYSLPQRLGAYARMSTTDVTLKNRLMRPYHTKLQDHVIKITEKDCTQDPNGNNQFMKKVSIAHTFKNAKLIKTQWDGQPANQTFASNIDERDVIWVLISANHGPTQTGYDPSVKMERLVVWRDQHGA